MSGITKHFTVVEGSKLDQEIKESRCTVVTPASTGIGDREYKKFVVVGFIEEKGRLKAELVTFCEPTDLLKADFSIKQAIKIAVEEGSLSPDDLIASLIEKLGGLL